MSSEDERRMKRFARQRATTLSVIVREVEERLLSEVIHRDGPIGEKEIRFACEQTANDLDLLESASYKLIRRFSLWDENSEYRSKRRDILGRLLVSRFEDQIEGRGAGSIYGGALPRFAIAGILGAIRGLIGTEIFDELQTDVTKIHNRLADGYEDSNAKEVWADLYEDPQAILCVVRMISRLAARFKKYDKRKRWTIEYVNVHVSPDINDSDPSHATWRFTRLHFSNIMNAFVRDARIMLNDTHGYQRMQEYFSDDEIRDMQLFIDQLATEITPSESV